METPRSTDGAGAAASGRVPGLAVASLVLGILGLLGSVVVIGAVLAAIGLILGAIHLARRSDGRGMGWAGVWISIVAIVASVGFGALYAFGIRQASRSMSMGGANSMGYADWQGKMAPDFEVKTLDGESMRLSDLKGRRVVLDFWATWCGPCVMEIPHFIQLQREIGTNDLVIVGVSAEDRAVLKPFVAAKGMNYPVASLVGVDLPEPYSRVRAIPTTFFLDRGGVIQQVEVGYKDYEALKQHATAADSPESGAGNPAQ